MTNEEQTLKRIQSGEVTIKFQCNFDFYNKLLEIPGAKEITQDYEIAVYCIRKQISKKPILKKHSVHSVDVKCVCGYCFYGIIDGKVCGGRMSNYCPDCGQKIDWSDCG